MEEILLFLKNHWDLIIEVVLALVTFILVLLKGKINVLENPSITSDILSKLPLWINKAEVRYGSGNGSKKFNCVLDQVIRYVAVTYGLSSDAFYIFYGKTIKTYIEEILSTPKKKED